MYMMMIDLLLLKKNTPPYLVNELTMARQAPDAIVLSLSLFKQLPLFAFASMILSLMHDCYDVFHSSTKPSIGCRYPRQNVVIPFI
jgi:hypothetical protein